MEMRNVFTVLLVILGVCTLAHGLKCYTCHNDDNKDCADTSTNQEQECQSENDSCSKILLKGKTSKGCAGFGKQKAAGCKKIGEGQTSVETCYCNGDFCNSAGTFKTYPILIVSSILVPLLSSFRL